MPFSAIGFLHFLNNVPGSHLLEIKKLSSVSGIILSTHSLRKITSASRIHIYLLSVASIAFLIPGIVYNEPGAIELPSISPRTECFGF